MNRSVNLLICLAILVGGIAVEAPADDAPSGTTVKPCCEGSETRSAKVGTASAECLQVLLYDDSTWAYWQADLYADSDCNAAPVEDYIWTPSGMSAPQYCDGTPGCMSFMSTEGCPVLKKPLPKGKNYIDVLDKLVHYPGLADDKTWNPKDALTDLGELRATFVKVKNAEGQYFAVRLSAGIAEMEKIKFPAGAFPSRPKSPNRKILIGFEAEMDRADIEKLNEALPIPWKRYEDCTTVFILNVANSSYRVTTTAANAVSISTKSPKPAKLKPVPPPPPEKGA